MYFIVFIIKITFFSFQKESISKETKLRMFLSFEDKFLFWKVKYDRLLKIQLNLIEDSVQSCFERLVF